MNTDPSTQEGIAIIGIGCRYPGVHGPLGFLDLIRSDRSTVSAPPEGRIALDDAIKQLPASDELNPDAIEEG